MANTLTKDEAVAEYTRLVNLYDDEDQDEYDEEAIDEELAELRSWARKQSLVFRWNEEQGTWILLEADEDTKATWQAERWLHRNAGLIASFMLQDKHTEQGDDPATVNSTSIVGVLPHQEDEPRTWLIRIDATADSGFGYSYPVKLYLTIRGEPGSDPLVAEATDEQMKQLEE